MTPRSCDMCGRSASEVRLSREHVLPQSLRDTVEESRDHTYTEGTGPQIASWTSPSAPSAPSATTAG